MLPSKTGFSKHTSLLPPLKEAAVENEGAVGG